MFKYINHIIFSRFLFFDKPLGGDLIKNIIPNFSSAKPKKKPVSNISDTGFLINRNPYHPSYGTIMTNLIMLLFIFITVKLSIKI